MVACKEIGEGTRKAPDLLGGIVMEPISTVEAYDVKLGSKRAANKQIADLVKRYVGRSLKNRSKNIDFEI